MRPPIHKNWKLNGTYYDIDGLHAKSLALIKSLHEHEQEAGLFLLQWIDCQDTITLETSGSTGVPKAMHLKKASMVSSALATGLFFNLKEGYTALHCLNSKYIAGKMMLVRAMVLGLHIDLTAPSIKPLADIYKTYDFCAMVPMQVEASLPKLHLLKTLIIGGAKVSATLCDSLKTSSVNSYETYGMTETVSHIALREIKAKTKGFKTLPNITISKDDRGCLVIDAPSICDSPVVTNDIVDIISPDTFEWVGRYDHVINSGGVKLIPEVIEKKLQPFIPYRFFVCGAKDAILGSKSVLVVECPHHLGESLSSRIKNLGVLSRFEVPKDIYFVPVFEETPSQKIDRLGTAKQLGIISW